MKKKNLLLVVLLLVVVAVASTATFAWLTDTDSSGEIKYTVGEVSYDIKSTLTSADKVVPGQSFGAVTITNKSNVLTNIRVLFTVTNDKGNQMTIGTDNTKDHILMKNTSSKWFLTDTLNADEDTNKYYYYGASSKQENIAANAAADGTVLDVLFDSLELNGNVVGNSYAGATITITVTFFAKQAEYIEWEEMGSIDFSTGIAKTN